jgi:NADH:ubiquinone oxidoreductase subunit 5 (subunit L)/multisubunit Na+/H+ antiporter MnhA subunit
MEGPTPVSALIHAATLVTAGVFLIIRCSPLFEFTPSVLFFILLIGGLTSFFAASIALTQDDIKKVIAYSTCSQLGYMIFICGLSAYNVSLFHLINHAFFKALLFLGAGSVIHAMQGEQDMRKFGSLINLIPYTYSLMLVGFFALAGFPFLSGFYSKDLILEIAFSKYNLSGVFSFWLGTMSAFLTAFYSFRVVYYTFLGKNISFKYYIQHVHELPNNMGFSLSVLSLGSIFSGYILKDSFVGIGNIFWGNSIYMLSSYNLGLDFEFIPLLIKNIPLFFSLLGILLAII